MEPDWDLHAVVRGFTANNNTTAKAAAASKADQGHTESSRAQKQADEQKMHGLCSTNLAMAENLHGLYKPILLDLGQTSTVQPTISSYMAALQAYKKRTHQQNKELQLCGTKPTSTFPKTNSADQNSQTTKKPKRRKDQPKKICHVPAEALSSDIWSWRKYGQKPIKGSPYPRSYYKCSSSKSCLARKQVERNRSDPAMFIVTYAAEHNHPAPTHKNSLAGTTRSQNPLSSTSSTAHDVSILPTSKHSSSSSTPTMSPEGSVEDEVLQQSNEIESMSVDIGGYSGANLVDDLMEFSNMDLTNYFFQDLDEIAGPPMDSLFSVQTPQSFPW